MDEQKLNVFMSMCRHLSFTKAAEDCHVVQSTMSKQIAALEKELGVKLFDRNGSQVALTPAGARLQKVAERYANQYRAINASAHKLVLELTDSLKLGFGFFEAFLIQDTLRAFSGQYPTVDLNLMQYSYSTLVAHARCGVVDLAFGTSLCANACANLEHVVLFKDKWFVAAAKDNAFWSMPPEEQGILKDQVVITTFNNEFEPVRPYCINNCLPIRAFTYSNSFISQLPLLLSNLGIALLPSYLKPYLPSDLRFEDVLAEPLYMDFTAIYNPDSENAALHSFVECCKNVYNTRNYAAQP